jgi:hypothetical protein
VGTFCSLEPRDLLSRNEGKEKRAFKKLARDFKVYTGNFSDTVFRALIASTVSSAAVSVVIS